MGGSALPATALHPGDSLGGGVRFDPSVRVHNNDTLGGGVALGHRIHQDDTLGGGPGFKR